MATQRELNLNYTAWVLEGSSATIHQDPFLAFGDLLLYLRGVCATHSSITFIHSHRELGNNRLQCLLPGPLTESRPLEYSTQTHTRASPKTPRWIIGGRRRGMCPGDRRDYWAKTFHCIRTLFISSMQGLSIDVLEYSFFNLSFGASHAHTVTLKLCPHKRALVLCDCYFDMVGCWMLSLDCTCTHTYIKDTHTVQTIMPKIVLDINISAPERINLFVVSHTPNKMGK